MSQALARSLLDSGRPARPCVPPHRYFPPFRFFTKVTKTAGCWLWNASKDGKGYGVIGLSVPVRRHGKAHRVSWELHKGAIPAGMAVLHKCDTPACVNPEHLFLGTQADNMRDCSAKGRIRTVINADIAREIYRDSRNHSVLSRHFGVSRRLVRMIKTKQAWQNATGAF